jgi:glycogen debranching enzyme
VSLWTNSDEPARLGEDGLMLVDGQVFCLSGPDGDVSPEHPQGFFVADSRVLSRIWLSLDGRPLERLAVAPVGAFGARIVLRPPAMEGGGHPEVVVVRNRWVGMGLSEDVEVRNYGLTGVTVRLELAVEADFASLFAVKERRVDHTGERSVAVDGDTLRFGWVHDDLRRRVELSFHGDGCTTTQSGAMWTVTVPAGDSRSVCWDARAGTDDEWLPSRVACQMSPQESPSIRLAEAWSASVPEVETDDEVLDRAVRRAVDDLGALRLFDPDGEVPPVVAAGAPWFMTLFGRDSLLTAWMALPVDPELAVGVLTALAALQGRRVDTATEEEPGRILHELRFDRSRELSFLGGCPYYGTADATPLYVMLLAEAADWGIDGDVIAGLVPHADRALAWIDDFGDRDGDGWVEYLRATDHGLVNQGWKDSWDGIRFADGRIAEPPIALAEVQAYVHGALRGRARLARHFGDRAGGVEWDERAEDLKRRFHRDFWLEDRGWYAVGLDADKRPIDSLTSNIGHCLWTGIVPDEAAPRVAAHLLGGDLWSGWGIRTLAASTPGYHPLSYHCGSVWPHDNAICAAGLRRYGFVNEANRVVRGLLELTERLDGRLPELVGGLSRDDIGEPVPYPTACSPQAWAAAAPLLLVRAVLGLEPRLTDASVAIDPWLPRGIGRLAVRGMRLGSHRVDVEVDGRGCRIEGLPAGIRVVRG